MLSVVHWRNRHDFLALLFLSSIQYTITTKFSHVFYMTLAPVLSSPDKFSSHGSPATHAEWELFAEQSNLWSNSPERKSRSPRLVQRPNPNEWFPDFPLPKTQLKHTWRTTGKKARNSTEKSRWLVKPISSHSELSALRSSNCIQRSSHNASQISQKLLMHACLRVKMSMGGMPCALQPGEKENSFELLSCSGFPS